MKIVNYFADVSGVMTFGWLIVALLPI